ncbi:MAG: aldo/keto reductase, partial [Gammaproteobacteria bacterium]
MQQAIFRHVIMIAFYPLVTHRTLCDVGVSLAQPFDLERLPRPPHDLPSVGIRDNAEDCVVARGTGALHHLLARQSTGKGSFAELDRGNMKGDSMDKTSFGRTGLNVSRLTFGCGAVGGLMTRGEGADQDYAVAWARDNGINFFDTAASYGDGASETNLGRALGGNTDGIVVSTKVGLNEPDLSDVAGAVRRSIDASLTRLNLDHVDIFQLHNTIGRSDRHGTLSADQVLADVVPAFDKLRDTGKTRFFGFTAKGEPGQVRRLVESGAFDSAQVFYNLLVPTAGEALPAGYPAEDYRQLLNVAEQHGVGAIGVRVLAGGALSGSEARHPL